MNETVILSEIKVDSSLQPRVNGLDAEHVKTLQAVPESWLPLSVVKQQGEQFLLVDGFHRYAAAQNLGLKELSVQVLEPPPDGDLYALSFELNSLHGKPLSLADRKVFACRLLKEHPDWADREIGRRSGLTQPTIACIRTELEKTAKIEQIPVRKGKGGYTYTVREDKSETNSESLPEENPVVQYLQKLLQFLEVRKNISWHSAKKTAEICRDFLGKKNAKALGLKLEKACNPIIETVTCLKNLAEDKK